MSIAEHVQAPQQGHLPLLKGQRLHSEGLVLSLLTDKGQAYHLALDQVDEKEHGWGFQPTQDQQRWLHRLKAKDAMRVDP